MLLFPPGWDPRGPYLALPVLKSFLKEKYGKHIEIRDLNVDFCDIVFSKQYLISILNARKELKNDKNVHI